MLKAIAEVQIIEKVKNQDMITSVNIFDEKDKIKVIKKDDDREVTVYYGTAKNFLMSINWAYQFLDNKKLESKKNWRC